MYYVQVKQKIIGKKAYLLSMLYITEYYITACFSCRALGTRTTRCTVRSIGIIQMFLGVAT